MRRKVNIGFQFTSWVHRRSCYIFCIKSSRLSYKVQKSKCSPNKNKIKISKFLIFVIWFRYIRMEFKGLANGKPDPGPAHQTLKTLLLLIKRCNRADSYDPSLFRRNFYKSQIDRSIFKTHLLNWLGRFLSIGLLMWASQIKFWHKKKKTFQNIT